MTLLVETIAISMCMLALSALPIFSQMVRRYSKLFFLLGTGALAGILLFDLLPDLIEMGGATSLWGVGIVWVVYSALHLSHLGHHGKADGHSEHSHHSHHSQHSYLFLCSMIGHCLASGVLLVASEGLATEINHTVFIALLSHKAYESLTVSSILLEKESSRKRALISIIAYASSLPVGVVLTYAFRSTLTPSVALIATSLAAGTLLGCLIFDFLLPSLTHLKTRRLDFAWIAAGILLTQVMMKAL